MYGTMDHCSTSAFGFQILGYGLYMGSAVRKKNLNSKTCVHYTVSFNFVLQIVFKNILLCEK